MTSIVFFGSSNTEGISLFRVDQINSTTITNKNRLTSHTDENWRHDLALYLLLSFMYRARFIQTSSEHEMLRFVELNTYKHLDKSHVVDVFSATTTRT